MAICIAPSTLARRAKAGRFNVVESGRLVALVAVFEEALSLFENYKAAATELMNSPVRELGSKHPIDMLGTRVETQAVLDFIGQLEEGVWFEVTKRRRLTVTSLILESARVPVAQNQ